MPNSSAPVVLLTDLDRQEGTPGRGGAAMAACRGECTEAFSTLDWRAMGALAGGGGVLLPARLEDRWTPPLPAGDGPPAGFPLGKKATLLSTE